MTSPTPGEIADLTSTLRDLSRRIAAGEQIPEDELADYHGRKNELLDRVNDIKEDTQ